ncbi:hypothetical protein KMAL_11600 [Novacetimonas maltaceti]|uniref:Uncharacterized protein n=1 Tax=Novacetimonas maltaceti TaxID=1203393 RepID=A0A2S3W2Z7_9PROT|nr:hypothetical protein KMAL_11600 [Novacetimonas maltaceti]
MTVQMQDKEMVAGITDGNRTALCQLDLDVEVCVTDRVVLPE